MEGGTPPWIISEKRLPYTSKDLYGITATNPVTLSILTSMFLVRKALVLFPVDLKESLPPQVEAITTPVQHSLDRGSVDQLIS